VNHIFNFKRMGSSFVFTLLGNSRGILQLEFWLKEFLFKQNRCATCAPGTYSIGILTRIGSQGVTKRGVKKLVSKKTFELQSSSLIILGNKLVIISNFFTVSN